MFGTERAVSTIARVSPILGTEGVYRVRRRSLIIYARACIVVVDLHCC